MEVVNVLCLSECVLVQCAGHAGHGTGTAASLLASRHCRHACAAAARSVLGPAAASCAGGFCLVCSSEVCSPVCCCVVMFARRTAVGVVLMRGAAATGALAVTRHECLQRAGVMLPTRGLGSTAGVRMRALAGDAAAQAGTPGALMGWKGWRAWRLVCAALASRQFFLGLRWVHSCVSVQRAHVLVSMQQPSAVVVVLPGRAHACVKTVHV
jgi:hypothetical protein